MLAIPTVKASFSWIFKAALSEKHKAFNLRSCAFCESKLSTPQEWPESVVNKWTWVAFCGQQVYSRPGCNVQHTRSLQLELWAAACDFKQSIIWIAKKEQLCKGRREREFSVLLIQATNGGFNFSALLLELQQSHWFKIVLVRLVGVVGTPNQIQTTGLRI